MKSLVVGEDNKNYEEICSTDKKNISRLSAIVRLGGQDTLVARFCGNETF